MSDEVRIPNLDLCHGLLRSHQRYMLKRAEFAVFRAKLVARYDDPEVHSTLAMMERMVEVMDQRFQAEMASVADAIERRQVEAVPLPDWLRAKPR